MKIILVNVLRQEDEINHWTVPQLCNYFFDRKKDSFRAGDGL